MPSFFVKFRASIGARRKSSSRSKVTKKEIATDVKSPVSVVDFDLSQRFSFDNNTTRSEDSDDNKVADLVPEVKYQIYDKELPLISPKVSKPLPQKHDEPTKIEQGKAREVSISELKRNDNMDVQIDVDAQVASLSELLDSELQEFRCLVEESTSNDDEERDTKDDPTPKTRSTAPRQETMVDKVINLSVSTSTSSPVSVDSTSIWEYNEPLDVPAKSEWIIGKRVKVKESYSDKKKRNKTGIITRWKTKNTVEVKCESGDVYGFQLKSLEFVDTNSTSIDSESKSVQESHTPSAEVETAASSLSVKESVSDQSCKLNTPNSGEETEKSVQQDSTSNVYKYPSDVPAKSEAIIGRKVKVTKGKNKNNIGTITSWKNKSTVEVTSVNDGKAFGVRLGSILFFDGNDEVVTREETMIPTTSTSKRLAKKVAKHIRRLSPRLAASSDKPSKILNDGESWKVPQSSDGKDNFGSFFVEKIHLVSKKGSGKSETTFFDHLLKDRMLAVEIPMKGQESFDKYVEKNGETFELVSCKISDDKQGFGFGKTKIAKLVYVKTSGNNLDSFSIEDHLLKIADFTTLNPRKIAARLELFQSPSNLKILFLDESDVEDVPDLGYVGGGFISDSKLFEVLVQAGMSKTHAKRVNAIQVRLFIPSMGVYKGMLMRKRSTSGAPIELPWGMRKVMKSVHPDAFQGAALLINKNKVHPSPSSGNDYIGRKLDSSRDPPPRKSFESKIKTPLSDMILRLWRTMGVSEDMCNAYKKESIKAARRNHAWLVGVPDPTNCLPPDTIFVPGMKEVDVQELFVTRSPCYAYEHGRKLRLVTEKPKDMSFEDWDWLNELYFGVIIFSNPRPGMKSIPERIASGDLDGDLYLICWDAEILSSMHASPLVDDVCEDDGRLATVPADQNWFKNTQDLIKDAAFINDIGHLTGKLYTLGEEIANKSDLKLQDPDANAYFEAFNQALEFKKHGRPIILPRHLLETIPESLRNHIMPQ